MWVNINQLFDVKDGGIVMKQEVSALIGELKLPEWKVVFKDGVV